MTFNEAHHNLLTLETANGYLPRLTAEANVESRLKHTVSVHHPPPIMVTFPCQCNIFELGIYSIGFQLYQVTLLVGCVKCVFTV